MGACASKFKGFKDDVSPPVEKEEVAAASRDVKIMKATVNKDEVPVAKEVNLVEETVSKDEVPAEDGEAKPRSLGHLLKEIEGEKGSVENENTTSPPEPVAADADAMDKAEKAPPATDDIKPNNPEEKNVEPDCENVGVEASDNKTEEKSVAETAKRKTEEELTDTTKLETTTETIKLEAKNAEAEKKIEENKLAEDTKIKTPSKVEEYDKHVLEPTKTENHVETTKKQPPVLDAEKTKDGEDETKN